MQSLASDYYSNDQSLVGHPGATEQRELAYIGVTIRLNPVHVAPENFKIAGQAVTSLVLIQLAIIIIGRISLTMSISFL